MNTIAELIKEKKHWTYRDYSLLPDEMRCEIRNGELCMEPSPTYGHQDISGELFIKLYEFVYKHQLGKVLHAPMDVYFDEKNVVQPDLLYISNKNSKIITEKNIQGAPDLVIEILSSSSIYNDRVEKMHIYAHFGVREYWIVDPKNEAVEVYQLINKKGGAMFKAVTAASGKGYIESKVLKGFKLKIEKIFRNR